MKIKFDMKLFIIVVLLLILLVGCGNDDFLVEELKVFLEIIFVFVMGDVQMCVVMLELFILGLIGVFLEGWFGIGYDKKDNIQYDYNVGWKFKMEMIYLGGEDVDVCVYKKIMKLDLFVKEVVFLVFQIYDVEIDLVYVIN